MFFTTNNQNPLPLDALLRFADWRSIRNGAQAAQARNLEVIGGGGKKGQKMFLQEGKEGSYNSTDKG